MRLASVLHSVLVPATAIAAVLPARGQAPDSSEFTILVESLATPTTPDRSVAGKLSTDSACMLRMELALQRLSGAHPTDPRLAATTSSALESLRACHRSMERIRELDRRVPDFENLAEKAIAARQGLYKRYKEQPLTDQETQSVDELLASFAVEALGTLWNAIELDGEKDAYQGHYRTFRAQGQSNAFFDDVCAPRYTQASYVPDGVLDLDLDGSWCNTYGGDVLALRNVSGRTLTRCVLRVFLEGEREVSGEGMTDVHLHYVPVWEPGETLYARYAARHSDGIVDDESVDTIASVQVALLSEQLRNTVEYQYLGPEFDQDVEWWLEEYLKPSWSGGWSAFEEGVLWDDDAAIRVQFESSRTNSIPIERMTAVLSRGGRTVATKVLVLSDERLESGTILGGAVWYLADLNRVDADKLELTLEFPSSSYEYTITWRY